MVLEALDRRAVNIKNLVLEEPIIENGVPFDPEREVTDGDWKKMKRMYEGVRMRFNSHNQPLDFTILGSNLKILLPKRAHELVLGDDEFSKLNDSLKRGHAVYGSDDPYTYAARCMRLKILFPERVSEFNVTEGARNWLEETLFTRSSHLNHLEMAKNMYLFDPTQFTPHLGFLIKPSDKKIREVSPEYRANIKILFPNINIEVSSKEWSRLITSFKELSGAGWWFDVAELGVAIKILAAQEVRVTDQGLDFIMPSPQKPFQLSIPVLPAVRRF